MNFDKIEDYSFGYELGRIHATFSHNYFFYKKVYVTGLENIPKNEAIILVGNHQNALMDAMAIICTNRWQPVFLARSDVFSNPVIAKLLIGLKILPIYRIRDGKESLKKNEDIFNANVNILKKKGVIGIFPEASHVGKRQLRTINKGVSRIAFKAEEESDFNLDLKIVPVGINYSNYFSFRSIVLVNYGKPISIADLKDEITQNPNNAHLQVRKRIEAGIKPLMIDIENDDLYDTFENLRTIYDKNMMEKLSLKKKNFQNKFIADKKMIDALNEYNETNSTDMSELKDKVSFYSEKIKKLKIRDWVVEKPKSWFSIFLHFLFLLVSFPLFLGGLVTNLIPFNIPKLITKKIKDLNFHTSIQFGLWMFLYPIFYVLIFALAWIFTEPFWVKWTLLFGLPLLSLFSFGYWRISMKLIGKLRYYFSYNSDEMKEIRASREEIVAKVDDIVDNYLKK